MFSHHLRAALLAATGMVVAAAPVSAQQYPSQTITFVVAFAPGGIADSAARIFADKVGARLGGTNVVIENRGGAAGNLGAKLVAAAAPDGHTVPVSSTAVAINDSLHKNKGYETTDLKPVAIPASAPEALAIHPNNPAKNMAEFLEAAKGKGVTFGSAGVGSPSYIQAQYFFQILAKVETVHVPFAGGAPAINALIGNHVQAVASTLPTVASAINQGVLRGLAIASPNRISVVPSAPTYTEGGFPNFFAYGWVGFFVPSKTSDAIAIRLNAAINDVLKMPDVQERLKTIGFEPRTGGPAETTDFFKSEIDHWGKMVRTIGASVQ